MLEEQIEYLGHNYKVIASENEFIVHPVAFGYGAIEAEAAQLSFSCSYQITDYKLQLNKLTIEKSDKAMIAKDISSDESYEFSQLWLPYSGALLIADGLIEEYQHMGRDANQSIPYFSYKKVYELVFNRGNLITTIDQSKMMLRIRKNLELGLRNMDNKRDSQCIHRFINANLIGDYRSFSSQNKRLKYLKNMKMLYRDSFASRKA